MTFAILTIIITVLALFVSQALRKIEQLTLRVEELEHDAGYGNF